MKNITKFEMIKQRDNLAQLNIVGLAPAVVKTLLKLHERVETTIAEYLRMEQQLIEKYDIKVFKNGEFDPTSENYDEFKESLHAIRAEEVDLSDLTSLTEDEAVIAVSKINAPIVIVAHVKGMLI